MTEDKQHWLSDLIKTALMHQLQERVAGLGICPRCHSKTLWTAHEALDMSFEQCEKCLTVYVLPHSNTKASGG